ncbi:hypothetical protein C4D60_Mb09t00990 [Musa balbisiana]|uniref:Uncharacterized protein n=1 Tax=Musa balbisiana TaxID=52838 RepID=A0A4S8ID86_MUSBA|nr:hypothetical protein C4D60_Mb09t00990 [Musa balbisiana]
MQIVLLYKSAQEILETKGATKLLNTPTKWKFWNGFEQISHSPRCISLAITAGEGDLADLPNNEAPPPPLLLGTGLGRPNRTPPTKPAPALAGRRSSSSSSAAACDAMT